MNSDEKQVVTGKRWQTREIMVGKIGIGGKNPIRIQSMTTSSTRDAKATIEQIIKLADAGCEIARVTVQGMKEAEACEEIKNGLLKRGYEIPLVADIHFFPPAAMRVVDFVDKVRINPGNYVDKRATFKIIEYDDAAYQKELEKIEEKFTPLIEKCKKLKRAMRIGTNHGSLSDRIMNRYGDSPKGMLESALEFARICRNNDYHDFLFSMKSSNPQVMVQAYRLLVVEMSRLGWDYPLHLGVTEAGEGEDGRIKSAMGIGALLLDGIGDTIRVSLTEDPWHEIDPCRRLIEFSCSYADKTEKVFNVMPRPVENVGRRPVELPPNISMHRDGTVIVSANAEQLALPDFYKQIGCEDATAHKVEAKRAAGPAGPGPGLGGPVTPLGYPKLKKNSADMVAVKPSSDSLNSHPLKLLMEAGISVITPSAIEGGVRLFTLQEAIKEQSEKSKNERFVVGFSPVASSSIALVIREETPLEWRNLLRLKPALIILRPNGDRLNYSRQFFQWLRDNRISIPVILNFVYACSKEDLIIQASAECGSLLCDGFGEGIWLEGPYEIGFIRQLGFAILQAARMRTTKTDFISCPSCGRTLFDLQDVTKRIRSRTAHLPGVKIAIMGCIVNGPGEMADADFGYVGSKPGMIDLYVGKECVQKDISFAEADDKLVGLIKSHGRWQEPDEG